MSLDIALERRGEVHVLVLGGRLDIDSAATLQLAVDDLMAGGARHLLLDATRLGYLSNAGLEVLVGLAERLKSAGSLRLCGLGPAALEAVAAAGQSQRLAIFPDRAAALAGHAPAQLDPQLVRDAARLLGVPAAGAAAGKVDAELLRAASRLLGVAPAGKAAAAAAPARREPVAAAPPTVGVLERIKRLFGGAR